MFDRFLLLCRGDPGVPRRGDAVIVAGWIPPLLRRGEVAVVHEGLPPVEGPLRLPAGLPPGAVVPRRLVPPRRVGTVGALLSSAPLPPRRVDLPAFQAAVETHWSRSGGDAGLVVAVGPELLPLALRLADRGHAVCAVPYDSVPLLLQRRAAHTERGIRRLWHRLEGLRWSRLYRRALARLPVLVFVAPEDAEDAVRRGPPGSAERVVVAPNGVDVERFRPGTERADRPAVVFSGDLGAPQSREGVELLREVMAEVWRERPEVGVVLAGRRPGPEAQGWSAQDRRVIVTGEVPDLRPWIREAWVYLAPLVSGTGVKNRVLEALALGKPVVATPMVAAGLPGTPPLRIAEAAGALAREALELLRDADARAAAGREARAYAVRHLSWEGQVRRVLAAWDTARRGGRGP